MAFTEGKIIDASFVIAPRQRNTVEENKQIKDGKGGELWKNQPTKKQHKDIDARWTKKNEETFYGYKNHAKVGQKSKLIDTYTVTNAAVHDSQALAELWNKKDEKQALYADSAYTGENQEQTMQENGMENQVCKKGYRNKPLTEKEKEENKKKPRIRSRVAHVFGFMEQSMHGLRVRAVGLTRATALIGLANLTYHLFRFEQIQRLVILSQG
jgi:IS5 family transposase